MSRLSVDALKRVNIPDRYFEDVSITDERFLDWVDNIEENIDKGYGLSIGVESLSDGTTIVTEIAKIAFEKQKTVLYLSIESFMLKKKDDFDDENTFNRRALEVDLLIIDDVFFRKEKIEWEDKELWQVLRERYKKKKATIVVIAYDNYEEMSSVNLELLDVSAKSIRLRRKNGESVFKGD